MSDSESIYREHVKPVYRYFYYKGVEVTDVEDLVQETFMRYFKTYGSNEYGTEDRAKILYGIAKNVWREWVRARIKHQVDRVEDWNDIPESENEFEEESLEDERYRVKVIQMVEALNPTLRAVLSLRFVEGMTRREVAARLQISEKDVHTYQKRGIKALQKKMKKTVPPLA